MLEILIVMALTAAVSGFGASAGTSLLQNFNFNSQHNLLINLLQRARSQSVNNINNLPHGVHASDQGYVLFQGDSWDSRDPAVDLSYGKSPGITISGTTDFIFTQLSGSAKNSGSINMAGSRGRSIIISVSDAGQIN